MAAEVTRLVIGSALPAETEATVTAEAPADVRRERQVGDRCRPWGPGGGSKYQRTVRHGI